MGAVARWNRTQQTDDEKLEFSAQRVAAVDHASLTSELRAALKEVQALGGQDIPAEWLLADLESNQKEVQLTSAQLRLEALKTKAVQQMQVGSQAVEGVSEQLATSQALHEIS